jgi:hypothetical protein
MLHTETTTFLYARLGQLHDAITALDAQRCACDEEMVRIWTELEARWAYGTLSEKVEVYRLGRGPGGGGDRV